VKRLKEKVVGLTEQRTAFLLGFVILIGVLVLSCVLAWRDIASRGDEEVRGPKSIWRVFITMNPGNSLFYWLFGRK
jgi:hypothetical protein